MTETAYPLLYYVQVMCSLKAMLKYNIMIYVFIFKYDRYCNG